MADINGNRSFRKGLSFQIMGNLEPRLTGPRLGQLQLPGKVSVETPNFFAITSRGTVPHIAPDILQSHSQFGGVHVALEDFIEKVGNDQPPLLACPGPSPLHSFTALPPTLYTVLAPRRSPAVSAPTGNSDTAISVFTSTGFQVLSNKSYAQYVRSIRPDIAVSLADIAYGSVPGTKRASKMGDRTQKWLIELLSEKADEQAVFAPILQVDAFSQMEYLNYITDELAGEVSGLAFYSSDLLPDIPATTSAFKLARLSLDEPSSPLNLIRQISLGMDLFTIPFIGFATDAGIALTFRFPCPSDGDEEARNRSEALPLGVNMWNSEHCASLKPLTQFCACYACTSHHRAYIQHLLSAKEMLGWVLLQVHNVQIISEFFAAIRQSIKMGTFEPDCEDFARSYESELPKETGQGPRVRGYHFKSEGPSEAKRNKAAWGNLGSDDQAVNGGLVPNQASGALETQGFAEKAAI